MGISDKIEAFIMELMKEDYAEFGRNELADIFGCVPSQINYVISTRFNPEKGYAVESRRGGGGYIKIRRVSLGGIDAVLDSIGESCDYPKASSVISYLFERGFMEKQTAKLMLCVLSDRSIPVNQPIRDRLRANILKNAIVELQKGV